MSLPENFANWTMAAALLWMAHLLLKMRREQRNSQGALLGLKSEIETFLRPRINFYYKGQIPRGLKMKDTEKVTLAIELDDAKGFPTGQAFDQPPVYTVDDASIASLVPSADGLSCDVVGQKPGNATVSVAGVAAGVSYAGSVVVPVTSGDPTQIKLSVGAAVPQ